MKLLTGCFSVVKTIATCFQAVVTGLFLITIISMDFACRIPGTLYNYATR